MPPPTLTSLQPLSEAPRPFGSLPYHPTSAASVTPRQTNTSDTPCSTGSILGLARAVRGRQRHGQLFHRVVFRRSLGRLIRRKRVFESGRPEIIGRETGLLGQFTTRGLLDRLPRLDPAGHRLPEGESRKHAVEHEIFMAVGSRSDDEDAYLNGKAHVPQLRQVLPKPTKSGE